MIHSLYSNKEIFLRELVSNASDACDKLRFEAIGQAGAVRGRPRARDPRRVRQGGAHDHRVGQRHRHESREEASSTSARSPRAARASSSPQLTGDQQKDAHLIGQFGVGFYSSFIVADRVTVVTRRAGAPPTEGVRWESDGAASSRRDRSRRPRAAPTSSCTCARARTSCSRRLG
jgi:molecular chaperone HtpG